MAEEPEDGSNITDRAAGGIEEAGLEEMIGENSM